MKPETLEMKGLAVHDIDGAKIGDVVDFYVDSDTNEPEWLVIESGVVDHKQALVPVSDLTRDDGGELKTPYPRSTIMSGPAIDGVSIDRETERALYQHFHLRRELPGRTTEKPAFEQNRSQTGDFRLRSWKAGSSA